jgi:hypothetical protein
MTQTTAAITIKSLAGMALCGALAFFMAATGIGPMEATSRMEQLAGQIERAQTIQPEAAAEIGRLTTNASYDCTQVSCGKELAARNRQARARLDNSLSQKVTVAMAGPAKQAQ